MLRPNPDKCQDLVLSVKLKILMRVVLLVPLPVHLLMLILLDIVIGVKQSQLLLLA